MMPAAVGERVRKRGAGVMGPMGGGVFVSEFQRTRMLDAAVVVLAEGGYTRMAARRVVARAGMSNKTFYDLFEGPEDCFLAVFDRAVGELEPVVVDAYRGQGEWVAGVRAGLAALLGFFDREPVLCRVMVLEALRGGSRVLARRVELLEVLREVVDQGRGGLRGAGELAPLTAEGVVGAVFGVIHTRLSQEPCGSLSGLLGELMAMIVLPYRGRGAVARELSRRAPGRGVDSRGSRSGSRGRPSRLAGDGSVPPDFRLTLCTHTVLVAVSELGGRGSNPNNREVAHAAGVSDYGQISKLLARLEQRGLLQNTGSTAKSATKAWQLTPNGQEIMHTGRFQREHQ
jgi:AcrR family transcriptional regulator